MFRSALWASHMCRYSQTLRLAHWQIGPVLPYPALMRTIWFRSINYFFFNSIVVYNIPVLPAYQSTFYVLSVPFSSFSVHDLIPHHQPHHWNRPRNLYDAYDIVVVPNNFGDDVPVPKNNVNVH